MPSSPSPAIPGPDLGTALDYSRRDYEGLRALMLRELARSIPGGEWGHPADPSTVLVEALAAAGDYLSYRLDIVGTEAYLATARRRSSVRRHARLLDYRLDDGCSARAWLGVEVSRDCILPAHTLAATHQDGLAPVIATSDATPFGSDTIFFETVSPALLRARDFKLRVEVSSLPAGAVEAKIAPPSRPLLPGDLLMFLGSGAGQVVRLIEVAPAAAGSIRLRWGQEDALSRDLPVEGLRVTGNVVLADHGRSFAFPLGDDLEVVTGFTDLSRTPPVDLATSGWAAAAPDGREARPDVRICDPGGAWSAVRDLIGAGRFARLFVAEPEQDGRLRLRFGDGLFGRSPPPPAGVPVLVRRGVGSAGNLPAGAIRHIVTDAPVTAVFQPFGAAGGSEPEPTDSARLYAPMAARDPAHVASARDAAALAASHPMVARATASAFGRLFKVNVEPAPPIDVVRAVAAVTPMLRDALAIGSRVEVGGPIPVPIDVTLQVHPSAGADPELLQARLAARFGRTARSPPSRLFGIAYPMGAPVFFSDLVEAVLAVEGAGSVDLFGGATRFLAPGPDGGPPTDGLPSGRIALDAGEIAAAGTVTFEVTGAAPR